jgi:hypothetical protein
MKLYIPKTSINTKAVDGFCFRLLSFLNNLKTYEQHSEILMRVVVFQDCPFQSSHLFYTPLSSNFSKYLQHRHCIERICLYTENSVIAVYFLPL